MSLLKKYTQDITGALLTSKYAQRVAGALHAWRWPLAAAVCTLLFPVWTADRGVGFSNSIFPVFLFLALALLFRYRDTLGCDRRMRRYTCIPGLLFSLMTACGYYLETDGRVPYKSLPMYLAVFFYTWVFSALLCVLWTWLMRLEERLHADTAAAAPTAVHSRSVLTFLASHPVLMAAVFVLFWTPCYLATFPGGFHYDASAELSQLENGFNGNFPMLHTVIITSLLPALKRLTGTYNTGIAVYTIGQMALAAAIFTHMLCKLLKQGVHRKLIGIFFLYYALFPVIPMVVTQTVRDILFSLLLVYAVFLFYLMSSEPEHFMTSVRKPFLLGMVFILALLARNNNAGTFMYIAVFGISILIWLKYRKKYFRAGSVFAASAIAGYLLLSMIFTRFCQPMVPADAGSSMSVFSQTLARAWQLEPELWTADEIAEYIRYFGGTDTVYVAENADSTKSRLFVEGDLPAFLRFWAKVGLKHKKCYLDAILANTRQMWFPAAVIDGYIESGTPDYLPFEKCYYFYSDSIEEPGVFRNLLPGVNRFYQKIGLFLSFERIPLLSMLFSIGFQFWILLNCAFYVMYRRCRHLYVPVLILLGYMIASAFVPLVLLRYFIAVFFALPLVLTFTLQPSLQKDGTVFSVL